MSKNEKFESADIAAAEPLEKAVRELHQHLQSASDIAPDGDHLRTMKRKVFFASNKFKEARSGLVAREGIAEDPLEIRTGMVEDGFEILGDVEGLLELVAGSRKIESDFGPRSIPNLVIPELKHESIRFAAQLLEKIARYVDRRRVSIRSQIERRDVQDKVLNIARNLAFLGEAIVLVEKLYERTQTKSESAWGHAANAMPALIAELLHLPHVESRLGLNVSADDLVETIRRQYKERIAAKAA